MRHSIESGALLRSLVRIEPGEGRSVALLMLYAAAAIGGVGALGLALGEALFLSRLPASDTPYLFILPAIGIVLALLAYRWAAARLRSDVLAAGLAAVLLCAFLLCRIALATPYGGSFPVLAAVYLIGEIAMSLLLTQFWTLAAQIFDPRQARRLFGPIAAGGTLAGVLAGLTMATLTRLIGVENLILIIAAALVVCCLCPLALGRDQAARARGLLDAPLRASLAEDLRLVRRSSLLAIVAGLIAVQALLTNIGGYQYFLALQATYAGRTQDMATFLGGFVCWTGVAAFVVQVVLTSRVLGRFGAFAGLLFFPIGVAVGAACVVATGGALWAAVLIYGCDPALRATINDAAMNVLYLPERPDHRQRAKRLMGVVYACTFGLAGGLFLLLSRVPSWTAARWAFPLLALAAIWLVVLWRGRRAYTRALVRSVRRRRFDPASAPIDIEDETTVRVLARAMQGSDARTVLHTLELIGEAPAARWDPHIALLLAHPSPEVQEAAVQRLGRAGNTAQAEAVAALFAAPEEGVRAAAVAAYCAITGSAAAPRVEPYLAATAPRLKGAAVAGLLQHGDDGVRRRAGDELARMLRSDDPATRRAGARALAASRPSAGPWDALLAPLLDDQDAGVRTGALGAAAALRSPALVPPLLARLESRDAGAAIAAIAAYGDEVLPALAGALAGASAAHAIRVQVPRVLARLGTARSADLLLAHLADPDARMRAALCRALAQLANGGVLPSRAAATLRAAIVAEMREYYALVALRADLDAGDARQLLHDTLSWRMERVLDRAFWLLGARHPGAGLERVREILADPRHGRRPLAIELLDTVVDRAIGDLLLPLVEAPADRVLQVARARFGLAGRPVGERLAELASGRDPWLRACAIYRIGALGERSLAPLVMEGLEDDEALVRETALAACRSLLEPEHFRRVLAGHAEGSGYPAVGRYARALLGQIGVRSA